MSRTNLKQIKKMNQNKKIRNGTDLKKDSSEMTNLKHDDSGKEKSERGHF